MSRPLQLKNGTRGISRRRRRCPDQQTTPAHQTAPANAVNESEQYGVTAAPPNKLKEATGPFLYKYLKKTHESAGHVTSSQMRKQLALVGGPPGGTWGMVDLVRDERGVCGGFSQTNGIPASSTRSTQHFDRHIAVDRLHVADARRISVRRAWSPK